MRTIGTCGWEFPVSGRCKGMLIQVTTHVGECDTCGRVWWIQRKSRHHAGGRIALPRNGSEYWAVVELIQGLRWSQEDADHWWDVAVQRWQELIELKKQVAEAKEAER